MRRICLLVSICLLLFVELIQGAEFHIAFIKMGKPISLDPTSISTTVEFNMALQLFEGLTTFDAETNTVLPGVAERWETSPDGLIYTFSLRRNAVWSDGTPVTAMTFRNSWLRALNPQTKAGYASQLFIIRQAKAYYEGQATADEVGIIVHNPFSLEVRLEYPAPFFLDLIALPVYMPVPDTVAQQPGITWATSEQLIGNGPFLLSAWPDQYTIELIKNPHYWDADAVNLDHVRYEFAYSNEMARTALEAYNMNRIQWVNKVNRLERIVTEDIAETLNRGTELVRFSMFATDFYRLNVTRPPLDDLRVRQALAMALDRIKIGKTLNDWGETPALTFIPRNSIPGYRNEPAYIEHPRKAQELLREAGYPDGKGFPELHILFDDNSDYEIIAQVVQKQWKEWLNINVTLEKREWAEYRKRVPNLEYDIARSSWVGDYLDPSTFLDIFELPMSSLNRTGWAHPEYSRLLHEARYTADTSQRMALYQKAEHILLQEGPIIPIYHAISLYLVKPHVQGIYPHSMDLHPLKHVRLKE